LIRLNMKILAIPGTVELMSESRNSARVRTTMKKSDMAIIIASRLLFLASAGLNLFFLGFFICFP